MEHSSDRPGPDAPEGRPPDAPPEAAIPPPTPPPSAAPSARPESTPPGPWRTRPEPPEARPPPEPLNPPSGPRPTLPSDPRRATPPFRRGGRRLPPGPPFDPEILYDEPTIRAVDPFAPRSSPPSTEPEARPLPSDDALAGARTPPRPGWGRSALVAAASGILGAALALGAFVLLDDDPPPPEASPVTVIERVTTEIVPSSGAGVLANAAAVGRAVIPSIVTVQVDSIGAESFLADSSGSGVVLDEAGHIVTNQHVVADSEVVRVVFADGRAYDAEVVGTDARTDLAVLEIAASDLTPIAVGSTTALSIGDAAIAVGSPLGLDGGPSLTVGVISAFERRVETGPDPARDVLYGMIQTDAPITRGSSGGALVDEAGRLIGITSAIGVSNVGAEGIGFAIPVEVVRRITDEILEAGLVRHAFLGIEGQTEFERQADGALVPVGVRVENVLDGTAAAAAGVQVGDRITSLDGTQVSAMETLVTRLLGYRVGSTTDLAVQRNGTELMIPVELGERPEGS